MAECKNRIRIDLRRAIWSGGFLIAIVATVVVQAQAVFEEYLKTKGDVLYYLSLTLQTGEMQVLMPSIASLCFIFPGLSRWILYIRANPRKREHIFAF